MNRKDVRVVEPRCEVDLAEEPLGTEAGRELRAEHLQRDQPVVLLVASQVDGDHTALPELTLEHVVVSQG